MSVPQAPNTSADMGAADMGAGAAAAMAEMRVVLRRLTPTERADFWKAVDLLYRVPFGSSISLQGSRAIQDGVAQGFRTRMPPA